MLISCYEVPNVDRPKRETGVECCEIMTTEPDSGLDAVAPPVCLLQLPAAVGWCRNKTFTPGTVLGKIKRGKRTYFTVRPDSAPPGFLLYPLFASEIITFVIVVCPKRK